MTEEINYNILSRTLLFMVNRLYSTQVHARRNGEGGSRPPWIVKISSKKVIFLVSSGKNLISRVLAHP